MASLCVKFHHEGYFMDEGMTNYAGQLTTWELDPDKWSYFEVVGILKELGYLEWIGIWHDINGVKKLLLRSSLKAHNDPKPQKPAETETDPQPKMTTQPKTVPTAQMNTQPKTVPIAQNTSQHESVGDGNRDQNETSGEVDRGQNETVEVHVRIDVEDETVFLQQDGYGSEDSDTAQKERFNDSDDEKGEFDGFDPVQEDEVAAPQQEDQVSPRQEAVADETQEAVAETSMKKKKGRPKKKNGRQKRMKTKESTTENVETHQVPFQEDSR